VVTTIVVTPTVPGLINNNVSVSTSSSDPNLANNSASETTLVNFSTAPTLALSISGFIFNDLNANSLQDMGEPGIATVTTFIDTNNNGVLNSPEEPFTTTDANGNFQFTNLSPGNYAVTEIVPSGSTTTTGNPVNVNLTNSDVTLFFGNAATTPTPTITASSINTLTNKGVDNDTLIGSNSAGIPKDFSSDDLFFYSPNQTKDIAADVVAGSDRIFVSSVGFGNLIPGAISPNQFALDTAALDINVQFIYDRPNGSLFYDPDGGGRISQVQLATLLNSPALSAADITLL
ncbi:SdrD B-like domain-containing protein, partial [Microcoleus sp. BR0-C5]|uniref:SdrD B-like domain-containing protein n=1 Tax=Microcoleus sp. BR0-C5 TaxID=2818713 RepID=UPI002FD3A671